MTKLTVNGSVANVDVAEDKPLLWVLREDLGLRGTKYGCGQGMCGACTVHVDGQAVRSCTTAIKSVSGRQVRTIEGIDDAIAEALKQTWIEKSVSQCGYCQAGQLMAAHHLLASKAKGEPLQADWQLTNHCRCGTYGRIRDAVEATATKLANKG